MPLSKIFVSSISRVCSVKCVFPGEVRYRDPGYVPKNSSIQSLSFHHTRIDPTGKWYFRNWQPFTERLKDNRGDRTEGRQLEARRTYGVKSEHTGRS
jgi:hypothetical protein